MSKVTIYDVVVKASVKTDTGKIFHEQFDFPMGIGDVDQSALKGTLTECLAALQEQLPIAIEAQLLKTIQDYETASTDAKQQVEVSRRLLAELRGDTA